MSSCIGQDYSFLSWQNTSPNISTLISPLNDSYTSDDTPTLSANYSDSDAGDTGTTNYRISSSSLSDCIDTVGINIAASGTSSATSDEDEDTEWFHSSSIGIDETYYWCAQNNDGVATSAWTEMGSFVLDTTTPDIVAIDAGASAADRISLTSDTWFKYSDTGSDDQLSFSWTDPASTSDDTFYYELNGISTNTITGDESTTTNAYIDDIAITEGTNYFHVRPKNGASVWGTERIFIVKYDKTNPIVSLSSSASGASTGDNTPTLAWSGSDATSGIAKYQLYIDSVLDTDNITSTSSAPANELACGSHTWYVRAYDNVDNYTDSDTFNLTMSCGGGLPSTAYNPPSAPVPNVENPQGKFIVLINNGDEYTDNQTVNLKLYAGSDTKRMAISNTADFKNASQEEYAPTKIWALSGCNTLSKNPPSPLLQSGNSQEGNTCVVYAKFFTAYGVASETVSDSIVLKTATAENQPETSNQGEAKPETKSDKNPESKENITAEDNKLPLITFTQTLQTGSNNNQVIALQDRLKQLNFFPKDIESNGNFGHATKQAVTEFQKSKNIFPSNGIVGPRTRKALNGEEFITNKDYQFTQDLKFNDKNEEVKQLQTRLRDQSFFPYNIPSTGWFGPITQAAVNVFQGFYNLIQNGIVDFSTREVLNR